MLVVVVVVVAVAVFVAVSEGVAVSEAAAIVLFLFLGAGIAHTPFVHATSMGDVLSTARRTCRMSLITYVRSHQSPSRGNMDMHNSDT